MFKLALILGAYAYGIFFLGIFEKLYPAQLLSISVVFTVIGWFFLRDEIKRLGGSIVKIHKNRFFLVVFVLLLLQIGIAILGVLGPEISFDALWYHLPLPKLYLLHHKVYFIPGGLLYYSVMPKITEMYYIVALAFSNETAAKAIHFLFGILSCIALYKLARLFLNSLFALLVVVLFYSNLVIGWESITAYIDLTRTFFEIMALWSFVVWFRYQIKKWLLLSGILVGLAISAKLVAVGTPVIFSALILYTLVTRKESPVIIIKQILIYWGCVLIIPLPWFLFALYQTGNPFYPLFTSLYPTSLSTQLLNPFYFFKEAGEILLRAPDPISPFYLMVLPLLFLVFRSFDKRYRIVVFYCVLAFVVWYITPRSGGGRFLMPYLPGFSLLAVGIVDQVKNTFLKNYLIGMIIFLVCLSIGYRAIANAKFIPVIIGKQTKSDFLSQHLNFSFGDFYDTDGYFKKHIKPTDKVLLYGFHNLYYVDFPFIDSSWYSGTKFYNYVATQNSQSTVTKNMKLMYENSTTHVKLYKKQ